MTYEADEASIEDSNPRELISIEINPPTGQVWHHTSGTKDLDVSGTRYTAIAIEREELKTPQIDDEADAQIILPIDHELAKRYPKQGTPPMRIRVTLRRLQVRSGEVRQLWTGYVTSMNADSQVARFLIPAATMETLKRPLPIVSVGRACPHVLYTEGTCRVSTAGSSPDGVPFKHTTTVIYVAGRDVRVDLSNVPAAHAMRSDWMRNGKIVHVASGEQRSIAVQTDLNPGVSTVAELQMYKRVVEMKVGDSVELYAGCDQTVPTCRDKFANRANYGGYPELPVKNPFKLKAAGSFGEDD